MAAKKTTTSSNRKTKGTKMTQTTRTPRTKKGAKVNEETSAADERAEAAEAIEVHTPGERAEAVEAISNESETSAADDTALETTPDQDVDFGDKLEEDEREAALERTRDDTIPGDATPAPTAPVPAPDADPLAEVETLLRSLGFERTGRIVEETTTSALRCAAETWRDRKDRESKVAAADVLSRAGWFLPPGATSTIDPTAPVIEPTAPTAPSTPPVDLESLRMKVESDKAALAATEETAAKMAATAKETYRASLAAYRDACRAAKVSVPEGRGRGANVSDRVKFLVERVDGGVKVAIEDRPETVEVIPLEALEASINKCAYAYTDKHIGPRETVGNKGGSLSNRLRLILTKDAAPVTGTNL